MFLSNSTCVSSCPPHFYADSSRTCLPCSDKCVSCQGHDNYCIDGCVSPFIYYDHKCVNDCDSGFYVLQVNVTCKNCMENITTRRYCEPCSQDCVECPDGICKKCEAGKILSNNMCIDSCPTSTYLTSAGSCAACSPACARCFGPDHKNCYACNLEAGYKQVASHVCIIPKCTSGTFYNVSSELCDACSTNCTECRSYSECTSCPRGFTLNYQKRICYDPCARVGIKRDPNTFGCVGITFCAFELKLPL